MEGKRTGPVMKKIIVADRMKQGINMDLLEELMEHELFTAYSNEDVLNIHRKERADLIITELYGSGMGALQLCSFLRADADLRRVSVIVYCRDNEIERSEAERCRANAILTLPVAETLLRRKVQEFLNIPSRGRFSARFSARRASGPGQGVIDCRTENISVTGMLIEADTELHRGDRIQYALALAGQQPFTMQAEVVRTEEHAMSAHRNRYGVRFSRIDPAARRAIEDLVSQSPAAH